uniref:TPX2 C-terminal domain-containing protein n=1 Tax=Arundo donax TaxID=35708 RepID=A0A0A9DCJ6_ARUDO
MATEVNQNYFAWSQEESSVQDISQGTSQVFGHGSISFGRFDLESLEWEKWSVFTNDRRHEEFGKFNGLVAKKKAYFEEYFKRIRDFKALQQQNQQTELYPEYSGDGSDSSQMGEYEPAADHGALTGSGTFIDGSTERITAATTFEQEMKCYDDHENGNLVNEISASTHSSLVGGLQQIGKQMIGNVSGRIDMSHNANSGQDDPGMAHETMMTPKRTIEKDSWIGQVSKIIPNAVKMTSSNVPDHTIVNKGPGSGKPSMINQMAKPENTLSLRRPREATCYLVGTTGRSGIAGLRRPSSAASQRPSTRERRPVTRDASRKPAEVNTPCRPSTSERHPATRESALKHVNNATTHRPDTSDRRPVTKESAPKQSNIATPRRPSTANRRPITKESETKLSSLATPPRPSTANRRPITKESETKLSSLATPRRPSTADRCPITKELSPNQSKIADRHPTTGDMATKHIGIVTSSQPSTDKHCPTTRDGVHKHADVVTLCRPSTAKRRLVAREVTPKHGIVDSPCRPSTAMRRPIARDVAPKLALPRPSTAERRSVTRETALKQANVTSSRWPLTSDRCLTKKSDISTPRRPFTGERRPITNDGTLKSDPKTPIMLRATLNYSKGAMVTGVTPKKAITPNAKSSKPENLTLLLQTYSGMLG